MVWCGFVYFASSAGLGVTSKCIFCVLKHGKVCKFIKINMYITSDVCVLVCAGSYASHTAAAPQRYIYQRSVDRVYVYYYYYFVSA